MSYYKTIQSPIAVEFKEKKSRFISYLMPVQSEEQANDFIEKIKKKHYDANHNVPVYVIGSDYHIQKYSDDGEPSGTAGLPILEILKKENITNIAIVVTRYFGGIKLGTGGLVRAYTKALKLGLEKAVIIEKKLYNVSEFELDYTLHGKFKNYISITEGILLGQEDFADVVKIKLFINPSKFDKIRKEIINMTAGSVSLENKQQQYLTFINNEFIGKDG